MRTFLIVVFAWSGAARALDLPQVPADALVEQEVCDVQIKAEILVSKDDTSADASHPSHYEGIRCTWKTDDTEVVTKEGVRTDETTAPFKATSSRQTVRTGSRENEILQMTVELGANASALNRFRVREENAYEVAGTSKVLVSRVADGETREVNEETSEVTSGSMRVITTTTRASGPSRFTDSGRQAKISFQQRICRLTRVSIPCPSVPMS